MSLSPVASFPLPAKMLVHVFSFLDLDSLGSASKVSRFFYNCSQMDSLWRPHADQRGLTSSEGQKSYKHLCVEYMKKYNSLITEILALPTEQQSVDAFQKKREIDATIKADPTLLIKLSSINFPPDSQEAQILREAGAKESALAAFQAVLCTASMTESLKGFLMLPLDEQKLIAWYMYIITNTNSSPNANTLIEELVRDDLLKFTSLLKPIVTLLCILRGILSSN